jgi:hypothetical protein
LATAFDESSNPVCSFSALTTSAGITTVDAGADDDATTAIPSGSKAISLEEECGSDTEADGGGGVDVGGGCCDGGEGEEEEEGEEEATHFFVLCAERRSILQISMC